MEIWLPCTGFENIIHVSNYARVKVLERVCHCIRKGKEITQIRPEIITSQCVANNGYQEVSVVIGKKRKKFRVHRLVAKEFVLGYEKDLTVNHIDGNKLNNLPSNLEWVTLSKNSKLEWETGLVDLKGDNNPNKKLTSGKVRIIRDLLNLGASPNSLSVLLDLNPSTIYLIRDGKRWSSIISNADII